MPLPDYETEILQHRGELEAFAEIVRKQNASSYLEIGAKFGGSLWHIAHALKPGSSIVAVDLPRGTIAWPRSEPSLLACAEQLRSEGFYVAIIWGDSTDPKVVEQVRQCGPFDVAMIDANHTLPYVTKDWANYGPMARMVAFHDINWSRQKMWKVQIDVPEFWAGIKGTYRSMEIKMDPTGQDNGFGILWR